MTIIDCRAYDFVPGTLPMWLDLYERRGRAIQRGYLGAAVGLRASVVGGLNRLVFMFAYRAADDRTARRVAMEADPAWRVYKQRSAGSSALVIQMFAPASFYVS